MENKNYKWFLLLFLGVVWGSSFILMQLGLKGVNAVQLATLRILFAGLFLLLIGFKQLTKIPSYKWKYIALTALCGTFMPAFLFATALQKIDGSVSAILNSLTPVNTLILGLLFFGLSVQKRQVFGVLLGFIGCVFLIVYGNSENTTENYYYAILVVIASISYGLNANLIKKNLSDLKPLTISVGNFAIMFLPALLILYSTGFFKSLNQPETTTALRYIAILGIVGTGLSNILFFKLIQISSPVFASSVTYIIPVVASLLGILFMNEQLNSIQIFGALIILLGVYLSSKKK
ncbi:DMT family transporter [Flavobacterium sp.]|uniref:DMT family transporter n=1 Tax=Flavobacterium sp. TaxID=239 RepID=UPI0035295C7B